MSCEWGEGNLLIPPDALPTWLTRLGWPPWSLYGTAEFPVAGFCTSTPSTRHPRHTALAPAPKLRSAHPWLSHPLLVFSVSSTSSTNFHKRYFAVSCTLQRTIAPKSSKS